MRYLHFNVFTVILLLSVVSCDETHRRLGQLLHHSSPPQMDDQSFQHWLTSNGAQLYNVRIASNVSHPHHRGMFSTAALTKHSIFLRVPFVLLLNVEHALDSRVLDMDWGQVLDAFPDDIILALHIAYQRHHPSSYHYPYLQYLPSQQSHPLLWSQGQIAELQSSEFRNFLQSRIQRAQKFHDSLPPQVNQAIAFADLLWGLSVLSSRAFGVQVLDRLNNEWVKASCLVPGADMMNSGIATMLNSDCYTNSDSTYFECRVERDVGPNEELLLPYSTHSTTLPNVQLLYEYGFVFKNNSNDLISLLLREPSATQTDSEHQPGGDRVHQIQSKLLQSLQRNRKGSNRFTITRPTELNETSPLSLESLQPYLLPFRDALSWLRVLNLVDSDVKPDTTPESTLSRLMKNKYLSIRNELQSVDELLSALYNRLNEYSKFSTIEQDLQVLKNQCQPQSLFTFDDPLCCAIQIRISEKQICKASIDLLKRYQALFNQLKSNQSTNKQQRKINDEL